MRSPCDSPGSRRGGRAIVEAVLLMSAAQVAGPKQQGRKTDLDFAHHGSQPGRVALKQCRFKVIKPRLRTRQSCLRSRRGRIMTITRQVFVVTLRTWKGEGAAIFERMMKTLDAGEEVLIAEPEGWNSKLERNGPRGLRTTPIRRPPGRK